VLPKDHGNEFGYLIMVDLEANLNFLQVVGRLGVDHEIIFGDLFDPADLQVFVEARLPDLDEFEERFPLVLEVG